MPDVTAPTVGPADDRLPELLSALEGLSIEQLTALITAAETIRQAKHAEARQHLIDEFRMKADALGVPLADLIAAVQGQSEPPNHKTPSGRKLPAIFRGPDGEEWTGKGKTPRWLVALEVEGRPREEFRV